MSSNSSRSLPTNFPIIKNENCVSVVSTSVKIDLQKIYLDAAADEGGDFSSVYKPRKINAVIVRMRDPKATVLLFSSGKFVCTGLKNEEDTKRAAEKILKRIHLCGYPNGVIVSIESKNLVATADMGFHIKMGELYKELMADASYEPELFPGMVYRMKQPKVSIIIFSSGKINFTGSSSQEGIRSALEIIYPLLCKFRY